MDENTHTDGTTVAGDVTMSAIEEALAADAIEEAEVMDEAEVSNEEISEEEISEEEISEEVLEDAAAEIANDEAKASAYADQEASADMVEPSAEVAKTAKGTKEKKERPPHPTFTTKSGALVHRLGGPDNIVLESADADLSAEDLQSKVTDFLSVVDGTAKKVQEKVINILASAAKGVKLSDFTKTALKLLLEKGSASSKEIYEAMIAAEWRVGTARSQSQQMMQLLPLVKIATRTKDTLTVNPDSVLAEHFKTTLFA
jgi:hypothetical protein